VQCTISWLLITLDGVRTLRVSKVWAFVSKHSRNSCFGEVAGESSRGEAAHRISCAFLLGGLLIFCVCGG